ncbi:unnamed protein product, partial [Meganyctiphanes norvegica]
EIGAMSEKAVLITSALAALSSGLAAWALYKWLSTEESLRKYTEKFEQLREVQRMLVQHFGDPNNLTHLKDLIPKSAHNYQARIAEFCKTMCDKYSVPRLRVLDVGCGVGGATYHLSKDFSEVIGTDISYAMITSSQQLKQFAEFGTPFPSEGGKHITLHKMRIPEGSDRSKVTFWDEDVCSLIYRCGKFDCILVSNTITHLHTPLDFLSDIKEYVNPHGLLIIADTYDWIEGPEVALQGKGR